MLAVEVFGRRADRFDPRSDTIVRVETRRLRQRLDAYFRGEGRDLPWRIGAAGGQLRAALLPAPRRCRLPAATRRARDLVERGEAFLRQPLSQATPEQARERFEAALAESPDHVPALRAWAAPGSTWPPAGTTRRPSPATMPPNLLRRAGAGAPATPMRTCCWGPSSMAST
ncbi:MAG: hypothetical protein U1F50_19295 [Rubrivivax sp.]